MKIKISACFEPLRFREFMESVLAAERCGYSRVWLSDSQMIWQDVYVYMAHALAATERFQVGTFVTNPVTRHYSTTAGAHATLADIHPGRVVLGIGRGESAVRTLGIKPLATREYAELVPKLRDLAAGRPVQEWDQTWRITWADQEIPLMMAATGPKNLRLAGALADVAMLQVGSLPAAAEWGVAQVRGGAEAAGRDPDDVEIGLTCAMHISEDPAEIHQKCAFSPVIAGNHLRRVLKASPEHGMPQELVDAAQATRVAYDYYEHCVPGADQYAQVTPQMIADFSIVGTPDQCVERIDALSEAGVDEIAAFPLNGEVEQMEIVRREVLPKLRSASRS